MCVSGTALAALPATVPPTTEPATGDDDRADRRPTDVAPTTAEPEPTTTTTTPYDDRRTDAGTGTRSGSGRYRPRPAVHLVRGHGRRDPYVPDRQQRHRAGRGDAAQRRDRRVRERHRGAGAVHLGGAGGRRGQHHRGRRERPGRGDQRLDEPDVWRTPRPRRVQPVERDHDDHVDRQQQRRVAGHRPQRLARRGLPAQSGRATRRVNRRRGRRWTGERRRDHRDGHDPAGGW